MSEHHAYKKLEMVGSSKTSIEDAISNVVNECHKTIKNMEWFEVVETRGHIVDGKIGHFQVVVKIGFKIESS
ncbi:dodecin family protein [Photobacterium sagamiensis]|uniref:dodecin n=1 Tax=Photobacterium sagamiensis TaxID=2910241 RepID=UPI003D12D7E7